MDKVRFPEFRDNFACLRGEMNQEDFAKFLGFSRPTVTLYESGKRIPDALALKTIAEKCGVSADWLLGLSDVRSPKPDVQLVCSTTGLSEDAIIELQKVWRPLHDSGIALQPNNVIEFILNSSDELSFQDNIMQHLQDAFQVMFRSPSWGETFPVDDPQLQAAVDLLGRNGFVYTLREDARDMYIEAALRTLRELFVEMIDDLCEYYWEEQEVSKNGEHFENTNH